NIATYAQAHQLVCGSDVYRAPAKVTNDNDVVAVDDMQVIFFELFCDVFHNHIGETFSVAYFVKLSPL
ncbi:hypothetical protein, partial [Pseudomonas helleri]|uniref:hypothetical protein n=1 Tax=Pseudomonas helleri TaxID=1608996 RepID=UPI001E474C7B